AASAVVHDALLAHFREGIGKLVADLVTNRAGNANAAGLRQCLQPCSDVDAVTIDVVAIDNDVAEIDADPKCDAFGLRRLGIAVDHSSLDLDRTADRVDDAREFRQHTVAGGFDNAPA